MKGIESIKALLKFAITASGKLIDIDANKDKRVTLSEIFSTLTTISFNIPALVDAIPEVVPEWKDLTRAEMDELITWFEQEFDLPPAHDKAEAIIKRIIKGAHDNIKLYQDLRTLLAA